MQAAGVQGTLSVCVCVCVCARTRARVWLESLHRYHDVFGFCRHGGFAGDTCLMRGVGRSSGRLVERPAEVMFNHYAGGKNIYLVIAMCGCIFFTVHLE